MAVATLVDSFNMPNQGASSTPKAGSNKCGKCKKVVKKDEKGILCEYCSLWYHLPCDGVSEELYNLIQNDQVHWFCKTCNNKAIEVMKLVQSLKDKQDAIEKKVDQVEKRVESIEKVEGSFKAKVQNVVREEVRETKFRDERISNVVITGMREVASDDTEDSDDDVNDADNDKDRVEALFSDVMKVENVTISEVYRIPSKNEEQPRPIVVKMATKVMKEKVLRKKKKLFEHPEWKHIFINPDLTKALREEEYRLREEKRERISKGEKNLIIRGGKVVKKAAKPPT